MKITIRNTDYELVVEFVNGNVVIEEIISIDGAEPFTTAPGYCQLIDFIEAYCQDGLILEYKRVCEQENGDSMIDRHLTESMD